MKKIFPLVKEPGLEVLATVQPNAVRVTVRTLVNPPDGEFWRERNWTIRDLLIKQAATGPMMPDESWVRLGWVVDDADPNTGGEHHHGEETPEREAGGAPAVDG